MKTGILTKDGARRLNRPDLEGKLVEYVERADVPGVPVIAGDIYHQGQRIGANVIHDV